MKFKLSKNEAQEVLGKICILADEPDLQDSYGITDDQARQLRHSVPCNGGEWDVQDGPLLDAVCGEIQDAVLILRDQTNFKNTGSRLAQCKMAARLERMFDVGGAA